MIKTKRKTLFLISVLLILTLLITPVLSASFLDVSRCISGSDTPTTSYAYSNGTGFGEGEDFGISCLINNPSTALTLVRGTFCCDHLETGDLTDSLGKLISSGCQVELTNAFTDNFNGTTTSCEPTFGFIQYGISHPSSPCQVNNYVGIEGYKSMAAYSGDLTMVPYVEWQLVNVTPSLFIDFSYTNIVNPLDVTFTDTSTGFTPLYYLWDFGDGESHVGIEKTVYHTFSHSGSYYVSHAATDFGSNTGWMNKTIYLNSESSGGYTLNVNPAQINLGGVTNLYLTSTNGFTNINVISYYSTDTVNFESFKMFRSYRHNDDGTWSMAENTSTPYLVTTDNPFSFNYQPPTYGNKTLTAYIYNKTGSYPVQYLSLIGTPTTQLNVITSSQNQLVNMYLYAYDAYTGAHLSNVTLTLIDYTLGGVTRTWNNVAYQEHVVLNAYDVCNLSAIKNDYTDGFMAFTVPLATGNLDNPNNPPQINQFVGVPLIPSWANQNVNNFTLVITAIDSITKEPIPNFKIIIPQLNIQQNSDNLGTQLIILAPYDITFSVTASALGYQSQTDNTGSFHPLSLRKIEFQLVKNPITPTKTPTPSLTFTLRPTPIQTGGGVIINGTMFCQEPNNIYDAIYYFFCTSGFNTSSAGLIIACLIMMFFACILGWFGQHALGFLVGALIGFIMSIGLGLIPFWILLGMLGLGILVGMLIIVGKGG
jgi:hypothetical protein